MIWIFKVSQTAATLCWMERHQKSESSMTVQSSNHQIERSWNILVSTYFWNIPVQFPPPFTEPVYFHFVLQDLSLCAPPPHSSSNAVKLLPLQRCSHRLLCKNLKNSPDSARSPPSPSSVCRHVSVCPGSPSSKLWTGRDLLFYPQRNSRGDRFQHCTINYWWLPLLCFSSPPEASCWGTLRENQSLRGLSLHLRTLQMGSYMTTHIYNLHAFYEILLEIVQNTHTILCIAAQMETVTPWGCRVHSTLY